MRNRFIGIISLCMVFSLLAGCGSVQAKDSTVPLSYSEEAREIIPDCEFYVIKDGGHEFFGQPFEDAMSYILPYLEGQLSGERVSETSESEEAEAMLQMTIGEQLMLNIHLSGQKKIVKMQ